MHFDPPTRRCIKISSLFEKGPSEKDKEKMATRATPPRPASLDEDWDMLMGSLGQLVVAIAVYMLLCILVHKTGLLNPPSSPPPSTTAKHPWRLDLRPLVRPLFFKILK